MSSALAIVLMAAMAVPGNGPERVSGEVIKVKLDLSGKWEMTIEPDRGMLIVVGAGSELIKMYHIQEEGDGKVRLRISKEWLLGIYRQDENRIFINAAPAKDGRPTSFDKKKSHVRISFRRIKTGK